MKNYDHNQDGYISLEDFEEIAANFPFSFCTHETDRWGSWNRHESLSIVHAKQRKHETDWLKHRDLRTYFCVILWKISLPGWDKSALKKSPLTSLGECLYVQNWATTSVTHITSMKPRINGQHSVSPVEALWVSVLSVLLKWSIKLHYHMYVCTLPAVGSHQAGLPLQG